MNFEKVHSLYEEQLPLKSSVINIVQEFIKRDPSMETSGSALQEVVEYFLLTLPQAQRTIRKYREQHPENLSPEEYGRKTKELDQVLYEQIEDSVLTATK